MNPLFGSPLIVQSKNYKVHEQLPGLEYTQHHLKAMICLTNIWQKMLVNKFSSFAAPDSSRVVCISMSNSDLQIEHVKETEVLVAFFDDQFSYVQDVSFGEGKFYPWMNLFVQYEEELLRATALKCQSCFGMTFESKTAKGLLGGLEVRLQDWDNWFKYWNIDC